MKWKKFDIIYANGSSLSAGGGLEHNTIKKYYKEKYGVEWDNEKDVTYPKYIADHFGCKLVHDAQSGSGAPRLVRRTYDYIKKYGIEVARKTLFLFEITDPIHRVDMYCNKIKDHLIVNVGYTAEGGLTHCAVNERISPSDQKYHHKEFEGEVQNDIENYIKKYHDPIVYTQKMIGELIGLFSFLEQNNIDYFYVFESESMCGPFSEIYDKLNIDRRLCLTKDCMSINHYCAHKKLTIKDETEGFTDDTHPGYFGNLEFSKEAIKYITEKIKPKIYVLGDSFTHSFEGHRLGQSEWFKKYLEYKGEVPKHFTDVLSEYYDCEVVNWGFNGVSNSTIFRKFIESYKSIRPNDIVIFGWTSISRFVIANDLNSFVNIIPFAGHPKQNDEVDISTTEQIGINRENYSVYWSEVTDYMKIISEILKTQIVLHWTWVKPTNSIPEKLFTESVLKLKQCINFVNWNKAPDDVKKMVTNDCDMFIDLSKHNNLIEVRKSAEDGMKIVLINSEGLGDKKMSEIQRELRILWYANEDYQGDCFRRMIPFKEYETIKEETNGKVNDLHYSENGSVELGETLISEIDDRLAPIFMRGSEFFDDRTDDKIEWTSVQAVKKIIRNLI